MHTFRRQRPPALRFALFLALLTTLVLSTSTAMAAAFTPGNIVVYRAGDGSAALSASAAAIFLDEYTPAGVLVQSVAMPTAVSGANKALTTAGSSTSEGLITRSTDGKFVFVPGYNAAPGTANLAASTSATNARVVGRVDSLAATDSSTAFTGDSSYSGSNIRGAAATNTANIWVSGTAGAVGNAGARITTLGGTTSTQLSNTVTNLRAIGIYSGQLYVSAQSGAFRLATVGAGVPATAGQTTVNLPGFPTATGSPYQFVFFDLNPGVPGVDTVYVADDGAGIGIQKWSFNGTTWSQNGAAITASGVRGLTGSVSGSTVTLFAASATNLFKVTDTAGYNASPSSAAATSIASVATNTAFRGVAFVPQASPTVLSVNRVNPSPTSAATVSYTVVFSQMVTGVDTSDFTLTTSGVTSAGVGTVTGAGDTYTVTVNTGSGQGTIRLDVTDDDTIADEGGTKLGGTGAGNGSFTTGQVYTVDHTPPTVSSIVATDPLTTNLASVHYTVTFSESVTGVDATDFSLATSGPTGASVTNVSGSGASYTVTIGTGSGDGTLRLDLVDDDSIADTAGNPLGGTGAGNGNTAGGSTYTIDKTAPAVSSVTRVSSATTNASSVDFTVTFSETVTGVDSTDFTLSTTGVTGTSVTNVAGSGATRTVTVNTGSGSGTIRLDVANDGTIKDLATNPLAATFNGGQIYTIDRTAPAVVSISPASASPTNAQSVNFTVTFSESVTGVDAGDFAVAMTGVTGASITNVSASGSTATVTVDTGSGDGTVGVNLVDDDTIVDLAGNPLGGTGAGNGNFTGQTYTIDKTAPFVTSITRVSGATTGAASVDFTVTFSEAVTGVDSTDFTITTTGVSGASVTNVAGSGSTRTLTVNTGTGNGTIRLDVTDDDTILDLATNPLGGSGAGNGNFTTGEAYTIDKTAPVVASIIRADSNPTNAGTLHFTVTFTGNVTGVDTTDFALTTSGVTGSISGVAGSGAIYTVTVSSVAGNGTLRLDVVDDDSITAVSNGAPLGGAGTGNGNFTGGEIYTVDQTAPTVTSVTRIGPALTNAGSVQFTVAFSEPVIGVGNGDFTVTTTGVSGASVTNTTGSGASYTVTVGTGSGDGTIRLDVLGATATITDAVGNPLTADFTTGDVITIDKTAPTVQSIVLASTNPSSAASVDFTVTFSEGVTGVDSADFTITAPALTGTSVSNVTGSGTTRTVTVATGTGNGSLRLDVTANGTILDAANNPLSVSFTTGQSYTMQGTPAAPANLAATPGNAHIALAWDPVSGATSYNVKRSTTTGTGYVTIASPATNSYDDTTAVNGTHYFYVVTAVGARGESANSNEANATALAPPAAPTGLTATPGNNHVALAWNTSVNATSYNVKRSITSGSGYVTIASPATNSYDDTTAVNGTPYFYVISGVGIGGEGANSSQASATPAPAANTSGLVLSQVYGGGGNSGSVFKNDFMEIFNRGVQSVNVTGWSVQYQSAAGTGSWQTTALTGTILPGHYYLVQEAVGAGGTTSLPAPDATGVISMAAGAAKVALVNTTTALSGACPSGTMIADLVGYGSTASCFEGSGPAPAPSATVSIFRANGGCTDTDNNAADFNTATTAPRNSASPTGNCSGFAVTGSASPSAVNAGASSLLTATVTPGVGPTSTGIAATIDLTAIGGSATQTLYDDGTNGDVTLGDNVFSYNATVPMATTSGVKSLNVTVTDAQLRTAGTTIPLTVNPTTISTIAQAKVDANSDSVPDLLGQLVRIQGVVTSIDFRGGTGIEYYIQDATGGIDVFNATTDFGPYSIGANVEVVGAITQFNGLTEITPSSIVAASGLPAVIAQTVTLSQLADGVGEPLEGKLVTVNGVTITSGAYPASGASGNVTITDGTGSGTMRIDSDTDIDGTTAPGSPFTLTGIVSQSDTTNPFTCCYQILPRGLSDITIQTPPIGSGGATPSSPAVNGTTLLTVAVTPGQNPTSTGVTVTADLTSIGGSATQTLFDNGTNGDVSGGDGTYSYMATIPPATTVGAKSLPITVADAQLRSTNGNISLHVQSATAPPAPTGLGATAGNLQVGMAWTASSGATGYNVYRATVTGGPYTTTVATGVATNMYTDTTVSNGTHYYYIVTAVNATDESGPSNEANAIPTAPPPMGSLGKVYFIDIGQGASTLIVSPTGKTLLVDGGPTGQGTAKVIPTLNALGISTLDYTVLTHYHIDHDGGLAEVIAAGRLAGTAYDNGDDPTLQPPNFSTSPTSTYGTYAGYVSAITSHSGTVTRQVATPGTVINLGGGMQATIMAQGGHLLSGGQVAIDNSDLNTESISVFVEYNNFDFLVSGDLTGGGSTDTANTPDVETYVAQMVGDVDMVEFDHHGSTTANNRRFLKILKAEAAEAEAGFTNTFGHPNRETFNKYLNIPATSGNTYAGTALPNPGNGPVAYQTDPSPTSDQRCTLQGYSGASTSNAGAGTLLLKTDGTSSFTIESFDDGGVRIPANAHVYALDNTGAGLTTNFPPTVQTSISPVVPLATDTVTVNAAVFDREDPIASVTLSYNINGIAQAPVMMSFSGGLYTATIAAQADGTRVDYTVTGVAGGKSTSFTNGYFSGTTSISSLRVMDALGSPLYWDYAARVQGVVTSGTGNFATGTNDDYLQDATGAINIWRTIQPTVPAVQSTVAGSIYSVTGRIGESAGRLRLEVSPPFVQPTTPYQITFISNSTVPAPLVKTLAQINANPESLEAQLITINNCHVTSGTIPTSPASIDGFLTVSDGTGSFQLKIDHNTDIPGMATPGGMFTITGILQQDDFLRPFDTGYDIAPRNRVDLGGTPQTGPGLVSIANARIDVDGSGNSPGDYVPDLLNQTVHIQGIVTSINFRASNGSGIEYYIQDPSAGVDLFSTATTRSFAIGDNLDVIGTVKQFNGLTEIDPGAIASNLTVLAPGTLPNVTAQVVTASQLGDSGAGEPLEGRLIRVNNVTLTSPPATFVASTNYAFTDATGTGTIRISASSNLVGAAPPAGAFSVVGVLGQFDSAAPFDSGYQLFPRSTADLLPAVATPASITTTAGSPQPAVINSLFATQLAATVKDSGNATISAVNVTFTAPASGASGTFTGGTTTATIATDGSGVATAPPFTANGIAGSYNVTATINALTTNFALTNLNPSTTHFSVSAPASITAGVAFNVTVTALDASNATVAGYTGTVHFSSGSSGALPSDYTFIGGDNGAHTFSMTLTTVGNQTIDVNDAANSLSGSASITVTPPPATHFNVSAPASVTAGVAFNITVTALDASNATVTGYTGTVHFTSSSGGTLPPDYPFVVGDAGAHTFSVTLTSTGSQSINAGDGSISGTTNTTVNPAPATHLSVSAPANVTAGIAFNVTVTALNASNATVTGYTGTVHFTSSSGGTLPPDYPFVVGDAGAHTFSVTLTSTGSQSINAGDGSISGTTNTTVNPAPATHLSVSAPANVTAGIAFNVTVTALNASNATVTGYTGTVHFTSTSSGTLPADYTFVVGDNGAHTFSVTLTSTGSRSITAADTGAPSITGTTSTTVGAAPAPPATHYSVVAPANPAPGTPFNVTVTALDASNATVTGYTGTVHFTSTGSASLPADYTFTGADAGVHTFSVTVNALGSQTLTAKDTSNASITGTATVNAVCSPPPPQPQPLPIVFPAVCSHSTGNVASVTPINGATFTWSLVNGTLTGGQGTASITYTAGATGFVSFSILVNTGAICNGTSTQTGTAAIKPAPTASLPLFVEACAGSTATIPVTLTGTAPFTIVWSDGVTQNNVTTTSTSRTIAASSSGRVLSITSVTDANCNTGSGARTTILVNSAPKIESQSADPTIREGETAHLSAYATGPSLRFQWYQGLVGDESHPVGDGFPDFRTSPLHTTTTYWLKVTNPCGSAQSQQFTVHVSVGRRRPSGH